MVVAAKNKCYRNILLARCGVLIAARSLEAQLAAILCQHQIAIRRDLQLVCSSKIELDSVGIGTWRYIKVVFQPALVAVERKINAGINFAICHTPELRNVP